MIEQLSKIIASFAVSVLFCLMTVKTLGVMQQSGYQTRGFLRWLSKKENMLVNRLGVLALCLALSTAIVSLCFSFLGVLAAQAVSALPFFALLIVYYKADSKYALKVPLKSTGRLRRLFAVHLVLTFCISYAFITLLAFLSARNGSSLYALISFVPFAVMPLCLPFVLVAANALTGVFENARNKKFVKRAGHVLDKRNVLRVGVVGSYGKTSVKNILSTLLSEKYVVVASPESYNTPVGIAKTVFLPQMQEAEVLIAEMGARKAGDIAELCHLIKPDYAVFTGVCEQHIHTFKTLENVWREKSEICKCGAKKVVCGARLKAWLERDFANEYRTENNRIICVDENAAQEVQMQATQTRFTLSLGGKQVDVCTKLLGEAAVENILLAATLALEMGLTVEEIQRGIAKLTQTPHRLQLIENGGVYILDDGYNANSQGAKQALAALGRFAGRKCVVTPGIVEGGVLEEKLNTELGAQIALVNPDKIVLVGDTLVTAVKNGYTGAGGEKEKLCVVKTLQEAQRLLAQWLQKEDVVLFLNDLPDVY